MATKPAAKPKQAAAPKAAAKKQAKPTSTAAKKPAAAAARGAVPTKVVETITLKAVFEQLAEAQEMPRKQAHAMAAGVIDLVTKHLKNGDRIRMSGLGILEVKDRPERMGRNPATGAAIKIAASKKVAFRAAKELKEVV
jgi:DNA-binding protein HU-beta